MNLRAMESAPRCGRTIMLFCQYRHLPVNAFWSEEHDDWRLDVNEMEYEGVIDQTISDAVFWCPIPSCWW